LPFQGELRITTRLLRARVNHKANIGYSLSPIRASCLGIGVAKQNINIPGPVGFARNIIAVLAAGNISQRLGQKPVENELACAAKPFVGICNVAALAFYQTDVFGKFVKSVPQVWKNRIFDDSGSAKPVM